MAKVTVYVTDDQLRVLKEKMGGASKAFQAFIEQMRDERGGRRPGGGYGFATRVMPRAAALDRLRRGVARQVQAGGPRADAGPIDLAIAVLVHREVLKAHPDLGAELEAEFSRFGLDALVAEEVAAFDPEAADEVEIEIDETVDDDAGRHGEESLFGDPHRFRLRMGRGGPKAFRLLGDDLEEIELPDLGDIGDGVREVIETFVRPRPRRMRVRVRPGDDPRDLLGATDLEAFRDRHPEWTGADPLTTEQVQTISELLEARFGGD